MNKAILKGRIARDIEMRYTQSGKAVASFTIAINRIGAKEGQQSADFINCIAWEKKAEVINNYMAKGSEILVEGRIQTRSYEQNGSKRYVTEVIVENVEFCGSKKDNEQQQEQKSIFEHQREQSGIAGYTGFGNAEPVAHNEDIPF